MSQLRTSRVLCFAAVLCLGALCPAQSVVSLGAHNIQPAATAVAGPGGKASRKGRIPDDVVTHSARAQAQAAAASGGIQTVFVIGMENQNFVQPTGLTTTPEQILGNPAAPYLNSLVKPGNPNAAQVSFASNYQSTQVHPSEPNYIWSQAGSNLGVYSDSDPYSLTGTPQNEQTTTQSLCNFLQQAGVSWKSYQEDINIDTGSNQALAPGQWTVPLFTVSGAFTTGVNRYNGSNLYSYGPRHNPPVFFTSTSGGFNTTTSNPEAQHYPPLQQLLADLTNNTVARYNWITPDLYNDMHTALPGGYTYHGTSYTGDQAEVAQGDNFLSQIVPLIMASQAYTNHGMIVLWWDETEGGDSPSYTMPLIVISPDAKGNAYTNNILYNHASDLLTIEEIFGVGQCPGFACLADDLSDLLVPGSVPEPPPTVYGYSIGKIIPEFTSFDQFGIARSIRDYQGQYVLLDMSAGWCVPSVYMARFSAGVGKTLTDAGVPFEYVSVLLEGNGNQGGGGEGSGYSNRFDAEEWAFEAHEDSPVLYNPYQPGVPSTYGLWNAIDAFSFGELPSLPTVVLLGPDQKILYEEIGAIDGQVLLNDLTPYLTRYSVKPGLVSPPPVPGPFDSVNLQVTVNGERLSADIPLAGASDATGCCSSESWVALGGLHLWASGSQNVYNSIVTPFGLVNAFGTGIDIVTDRGVCMFAGGSKCPSDYLPTGTITLQLSGWKTLRWGAPREVGAASFSFPPSYLTAYVQNDQLFAAGGAEFLAVPFVSFFPYIGTAVDGTMAPGFELPLPVVTGSLWHLGAFVPEFTQAPGVRMNFMTEEIAEAGLVPATAQSLTGALSAAIAAMSPNGNQAACDGLQRFSGLVNGATAGQIPQTFAQRLLEEAARAENLLGCPVSAPATGSSCNGLYSGTFNGDLTVSPGQNCVFVNGTVTGNVQIDGGSLVLTQTDVGGNVQIGGKSAFNIGSGTAIGGNLEIQSLAASAGQNQLCGSTVNNDVTFQNNGTAVLIGASAPASCAGNYIGGNLTVQNNSASTVVSGNTVTGNLQDQNNTAPTQVFTNTVGNNLQCQQNTSITAGGNTAKSKQGQCVAF